MSPFLPAFEKSESPQWRQGCAFPFKDLELKGKWVTIPAVPTGNPLLRAHSSESELIPEVIGSREEADRGARQPVSGCCWGPGALNAGLAPTSQRAELCNHPGQSCVGSWEKCAHSCTCGLHKDQVGCHGSRNSSQNEEDEETRTRQRRNFVG